MNMKTVSMLVAVLVTFESAVLVGLIASHSRVLVSHNVSTKVDPLIFNPLYGALEYEAPDKKFEALVKEHPEWILYRPPGASNSILASCAELKRTNYIRILIANGANIEEAVDDENKKKNEEAAQLLQQIQSEVKP
jgi:hypothetical protein